MESLTGDGHLHPGHPYNGHRRSPSLRGGSPLIRTPSPRRRGHHLHHDIGFSDTVSNVVEIVKGERSRRPYGPGSRFTRARYGPHGDAAHHRSRRNHLQYPTYGTTSLCQRSRSPSPARLKEMRDRYRLLDDEMGGTHHVQLSYPVLVPGRRRLPPTPCKPSTLQLKPTNINFPKLNASPTHTHHSTPHSVHSLPHSRDFLRDQRDFYYASRERDRMRDRGRDYDLRYEYRDKERERYELEREREREREREIERERE
uniref:Uncharacterized protein n=1 Tax=Phlebotomus papatasi TaxID=29031 RepID=A0A1B0DPU3_PHLPP